MLRFLAPDSWEGAVFLGLFYRRCSGRPTFNVYLTEQFKEGLGGVMLGTATVCVSIYMSLTKN